MSSWWGGGFGPNILSLLVLIKIRTRIKTRLWQLQWLYICTIHWPKPVSYCTVLRHANNQTLILFQYFFVEIVRTKTTFNASEFLIPEKVKMQEKSLVVLISPSYSNFKFKNYWTRCCFFSSLYAFITLSNTFYGSLSEDSESELIWKP